MNTEKHVEIWKKKKKVNKINKFKKGRISKKPLIGCKSGACPEKVPSLRKREILPHFSLHHDNERTLFPAAANSEHMCRLGFTV